MKASMLSTDRMIDINGVPARVWEGRTENGVPFTAAITRIAVHPEADNSEFEKELQEHTPPSDETLQVWPLKIVI